MAARMEHVKDIIASIDSLTLQFVDDVELPL